MSKKVTIIEEDKGIPPWVVAIIVLIFAFVLLESAFKYVYNILYPPCNGSFNYTVNNISTKFDSSDRSIRLSLDDLANTSNSSSNKLKVEVWAYDTAQIRQVTSGTKLGEHDIDDTLPAGYSFSHLSEKISVENFPTFEQPKTIKVCVLEQCDTDKAYKRALCRDTNPPYTFKENEWRNILQRWWHHTFD